MPSTMINRFHLHYEESGSGSPVLFVHGGFPSLASTFEDPARLAWSWEHEFARAFRFIAYDRRRCYRSSCPAGGYDLENQARDVEQLLDYLGVERTHLLGSSAGGPIAVVFAATRPGRLCSLTLQGTALELFPRGDPVSDVIRRQIQLLEREGPVAAFDRRPAGVEAWYQSLWGRDEAEARGELAGLLAWEQALAGRAAGVPRAERIRRHTAELLGMRACMEVDLRAYAARVRAPTLVLHGTADRTVPFAWGQELAAAIPTAHLHTIEHGPHTLVARNAEARQVAMAFMHGTERPAREAP